MDHETISEHILRHQQQQQQLVGVSKSVSRCSKRRLGVGAHRSLTSSWSRSGSINFRLSLYRASVDRLAAVTTGPAAETARIVIPDNAARSRVKSVD